MQSHEVLRYEQSPLKIDYLNKRLVRMNLNENLVLPRKLIKFLATRSIDRLDLRHYPSNMESGEVLTLRREIARYCNCSTGSVAIGSGSDQVMDLLFRASLKKMSDKLLTIDPTFSMYGVLASRLGSKTVFVKAQASNYGGGAFSLDFKRLLVKCKDKNVKIIVLASPNNPTGIQYPLQEIEALVACLPDKTFMLDEAYVEYAEYSATSLLRSYPNLFIARTFSKAFGLASLRLGYLVCSNERIIEEINNELQYPFPITTLSAIIATDMLRKKDVVIRYAKKTKRLRQEMIESLSTLGKGIRVVSQSNTNFVLVQCPKAWKIAVDLLSNYAIALKYIPKLGREKEFLRISVGTREMNQKLLRALQKVA